MDVATMASKGQRAMRAAQSKAEKIFWPMQAGRPRQGRPGLLEAVHIGRSTADRLYRAVAEADLEVGDAGCVLICDLGANVAQAMGRFTTENSDSSDLTMARDILNAKAPLLGVAFWLWDKEKGQVLTHARPFERGEHAERLLSVVLDEWELVFKKTGMPPRRSN